jgi:hypothetical protein
MPAKMGIQELREAIHTKSVMDDLEAFALGILLNEQRYYKRQPDITAEAMLSPGPKLDLGFYSAIALLDKLADDHPLPAKRMMEAILSFDTMGRYLLEERPIVMDGEPFFLEPILLKLGIDIHTLRRNVLMRSKTLFVNLQDPGMQSSFPDPSVIAEPLSEAVKQGLTQAKFFSEIEALRKKGAKLGLDFRLISEVPSDDNLIKLLSIFAEIFAHAKTQDSVKLDRLDCEMPPGGDLNEYSLTAFLQNMLSVWLVLGLVDASSIDVFNRRLHFLSCLLQRATSKEPVLPAYANADLYLPLITMARDFSMSALEHHQLLRPSMRKIKLLNEIHNAIAVTKFTSRFYTLSQDGIKHPLPPMRMNMTTLIEYSYEFGQDHLVRGKAVFEYFKPKGQHDVGDLAKLSDDASMLLKALVRIKNIRPSCLHRQGLIASAYPLHRIEEPIDAQLKTLAFSLLSSTPRIYYRGRSGSVVALEGEIALSYVHDQIARLRSEGSLHCLTLELSWCDNLSRSLDGIVDRYATLMRSHISLPKHPARPPQETSHRFSWLAAAKARFATPGERTLPQQVGLEKSHLSPEQALSGTLPRLVNDKKPVLAPRILPQIDRSPSSPGTQGLFCSPTHQSLMYPVQERSSASFVKKISSV